MVRRGEIFYIHNQGGDGDTKPARPAIIVSNNKGNMNSSYYEVVFLTTQEKKELPTHVDIFSTGRESTALCEKISTIHCDCIGNYVAMCTDDEMKRVDKALLISLGIDTSDEDRAEPERVTDVAPPEVQHDDSTCDALRDDLMKVRTECALYKKLFEQLMEKVIK